MLPVGIYKLAEEPVALMETSSMAVAVLSAPTKTVLDA